MLLSYFSSILTLFSEIPFCFDHAIESKLSEAISQAKPLFSDIDLPSRPLATLPAAINKYARW